MEKEAPTTDPGELEGQERPDHGSRGAAVAAAVALVAVALVPAAAPTAAAGGDAGTCVPPDDPYDVGLVLDRSGSMGGAKIDAARQGAIQLVENLTPNDQSGLVSYATQARLDDPLSFDHPRTAEAVAGLQAGGSTATGDAIDLSHRDLQDRGRSDAAPTMILLTDGKTNEGADPVTEAQEAKDDGVEIYAIGVGSSVNEQELKTIASDPVDDHYFQVSGADEIVEVFQDLAGVVAGEAPYAGEAYGVNASAANPDPRAEAGVHEVPRTSTASGTDATAAKVHRTAGGYTVEASLVSARTEGTAGPDNVTGTSTVEIQNLEIQGPSGTLLSAETLTTRAHAWSAPDGAATGGSVLGVSDLEAPGAGPGPAVDAPVPPNTEVPLPGVGTLTLNEQTETEDDGNVTIRVNLLHLEADEGGSPAEVIVGSAYAAAACSTETSFTTPGEPEDPFSLETVDQEASAGPATVNPGGCAEDEVAASVSGCSEGDVAASGTDEARNRGEGDCGTDEVCVAASGTGAARNAEDDCDGAAACVAVSGTGPAQNARDDCGGAGTACVAASGTGEAQNTGDGCVTLGTLCVAASGTGDADPTGAGCPGLACVAASGTGDAEGVVAASGTGYARGLLVAVTGTGTAEGFVAAGATGTCNGWTCNDLNLTGPARGHNTAVSGNGSSEARQGAAVSGTGPAYAEIGAAASGTGPAETGLGASASGTDEARGLVAVTGTGTAEGFVAAGATGTCNGWTCNDLNLTGPARGHNTAVSGTDEAQSRQGAAVSGTDDASTQIGVAASGTGDAHADTGAAVSGCTGAEANVLGATLVGAGSPAPVCEAPAAEGASLLP